VASRQTRRTHRSAECDALSVKPTKAHLDVIDRPEAERMLVNIRRVALLAVVPLSSWVAVGAVPSGAHDPPLVYLDSLVARHRFFELRDSIDITAGLPPDHMRLYRGILAGAFNDDSSASRVLVSYLANRKLQKSNFHLRAALEALAASQRRVGAYAAAAKTYRELIDTLGGRLDSATTADYRHDERFASALRHVPPQRVSWLPGSDSTIGADRSYAMHVSIGGIDVDSTLAFDTGANYTVIDRATARTHHVQILGDTIDVETITGKTKAVHIGVIPTLTIGAVTISNVIALVMEDSDLDIPEAHFHLTGLIGFPPLIAAGDATLFPNGRIVLYRHGLSPVSRVHANLALEGVQPLLEVTAGTHNFVMSLDTGAGATFLYRGFLDRAPELLRDARADSITFGGVGNLARLTSISLSNVALRIAGADVLVPKITALETRTSTTSTYLDGNLGRDVLTRLGIVTLNFSSMRLSVR
jgi:hypothetical protein